MQVEGPAWLMLFKNKSVACETKGLGEGEVAFLGSEKLASWVGKTCTPRGSSRGYLDLHLDLTSSWSSTKLSHRHCSCDYNCQQLKAISAAA